MAVDKEYLFLYFDEFLSKSPREERRDPTLEEVETAGYRGHLDALYAGSLPAALTDYNRNRLLPEAEAGQPTERVYIRDLLEPL